MMAPEVMVPETVRFGAVWLPEKVFAPRPANGEQVNGWAVTALPEAQVFGARATVVDPPSETEPPPVRPAPAFTPSAGLANMALLTPAAGMLRLTLPVVPPPKRPVPAVTPVMVPTPLPPPVPRCPLESTYSGTPVEVLPP